MSRSLSWSLRSQCRLSRSKPQSGLRLRPRIPRRRLPALLADSGRRGTVVDAATDAAASRTKRRRVATGMRPQLGLPFQFGLHQPELPRSMPGRLRPQRHLSRRESQPHLRLRFRLRRRTDPPVLAAGGSSSAARARCRRAVHTFTLRSVRRVSSHQRPSRLFVFARLLR